MRAIGSAVARRSIEFCRQLRLEAAARLFKASFSPGDVPQHRVQPLGTEYQHPEHENEKYFCAEAHRSSLHSLIVVSDSGRADGLLFVSLDGRFETPNAFSDAFAKLGKFLGSEDQQGNSENH
jgi:hypothetical protein